MLATARTTSLQVELEGVAVQPFVYCMGEDGLHGEFQNNYG